MHRKSKTTVANTGPDYAVWENSSGNEADSSVIRRQT